MALTFKVGFQVDDRNLRQGLQGIQQDIERAFNVKTGMSDEIAKATQQAMILEKAMKRATTDKGVSYYALNSELQKAGTTAAKLTTTLAKGGQGFVASLNAANVALAQSDRTLLSLNAKIREMSRVMVQSFKFTAAQTTLQAISNAARDAYQWVYDLDKTITNIGIVTGYTGDKLDQITKNAITGARELRIAANDYAEGALIFYQQGLGDDEVAQRVEITAKAARAAGESLEQMSSQLTAIWNTYKMTGDEMERAASVGAKMAGDTAVDFADIAEAMQTAAAPAEQMGVSYNSLAAIIATVGDTTQQSASVIGNAFKTIFSRFQQLKAEGTDGEVTLNRVSSQLQQLGVNVLDAGGELRSLDSVIAEVGSQWDNWSSKQQLAIAQLVGGTRQYGQFLTLMNNFDKYQDLLSSANMEDGSTLEQQYQSSLDSIESHAENAGEAWKRAFGSLIDEDSVKDVLSAVEAVGNGLEDIFDLLGSTKGLALYIATIFAKQWTGALLNAGKNIKTIVTNLSPKQREKNINAEYDKSDAELATAAANTSNPEEKRSIELQQQKNKFGRETAIINDKINTSLKTANSYQRILLNFQKDSLKYAQEQYQSSLDRLSALQQEADKKKNLVSLEEQGASAEERKAQAILKGYQDRLAKLEPNAPTEEEYNDAIATKNRPDASKEEIEMANTIIKKYEEILRLKQKIADASDKAFEASLMTKTAQETTKLQQSFLKAESTVTKFGLSGQKSSKEAMRAVQDFNKKVREAAKESDVMTQMLEDMKIPEDITNSNLRYLEKMLRKLNEIAQAGGVATDVMVDMGAEAVDATEQRNSSEERQQEAGRNTNPEQGPEESAPNKIDWSGVISGAAQAATAISSFGMITSSVFNTLNDDSASFGDKFFAVASAIGFAIPMITSMNTAVVALGNAFKLEAAAQEGANAITVISAATSSLLAKAKNALTLSSIKEAASAAGAAIAHGAQAVAAGIAAVATQGLTISIGALTLTFPPLLVIVLAVVAAFAALVAIVKAVQFIFDLLAKNELKENLNDAKESAEMFASALEDAKTEAENLKSAFDSYESVKKTLDECAQGTEEWKKALNDVNNEVLGLMEQYPELAGMVNEETGERAITRNETTGELQVADWAMEEMENKADQKVNNTRAASIHANQDVRKAQIALDKNEAGLDNASDAALSALGANSDVFSLTGDALVSEISKIFEENGINESAEVYAKAIEENTIACSDLAKEVYSNTIATQTENDTIAQAALVGTEYENSDLGLSQGGKQYDKVYNQKYEEELGKLKTNIWGVGSDDFKEAFANYQKGMLSDYENLEVTNYKRNGDVDIKYTDENGDEQTETIKKEDIAKFNAGAAAAEALGASMELLDTDVRNLSTSTKDSTQANEAAAKAITEGDLGNLTKTQLEDLKAKATSPEDMAAYLQGQGMSKENADIYGKELYDQVTSIDWNEILKGIEVPDSAIANFTTAQAQKLGKAYETIGEIGGEEMQGQIESIITEADKMGLGDEVAKKLGEVDFTSWESIEEFEDYLNSIGLDFESLGINLDDFTNKLQNADGVLRTVDPSAINEKYKEIFDFMEDINIGDTISEEDFLKLDANMQGFFQDMGDGTYQLTQDAETFLNTLKEAQLNDLMNEAEKAGQNYSSAANTTYDSPEDKNAAMTAAQQDMVTTQTAVLGMAQSLAEFDAIYAQLSATMGEAGVQLQAKAAALTQLATQFDNTSDEIEAYNQALTNLAQHNTEANKEALALAESNLRVATTLGEAAEKYDLNAEVLETQTKEIAKAKGISEEAAATMAVANQRLNKGITQLNENWEDWSKTLKKSDKTTQDYAEVLTDLSDAVGDIVGWYEDLNLSSEFVEENMDLISSAAEGNTTAILQLGAAVAEASVMEAELNQATYDAIGPLTSAQDVADGTATAFEAIWATMAKGTTAAEAFAQVQSNVAAGFNTISSSMTALQNGASLSEVFGSQEDLNAWVANLNAYASATQMTAEEMNQMLGSVGVTANVTTEYQEQEIEVPTYTEHVIPLPAETVQQGEDADGNPNMVTYTPVKKYSVPGEPMKTKGFVAVAKIESVTPDGGGTAVPDIQFTGKMPPTPSATGGNKSGGSKGGGGGSTPKHQAKKAEKRQSMKIGDRYSSVQSKIDDVQRSLDNLSSQQDDMWGGAHLRALAKYNKELEKQAGYYKEMLKMAKKYTKEDQVSADALRKETGNKIGANLIGIQFDDDGFVKNRTEIINQLDDELEKKYQVYKQAADAYDAKKSTSQEESDRVDKLKEEYEDYEKYVNDYIASIDQIDDSAMKAYETLQKLVEGIRQEIANRVEIITYKIELKMDMNDLEIRQLERSIEHLGEVGLETGKRFGKLRDIFTKNADAAWMASDGIWKLETMLNNLNTEAGKSEFIDKFGPEAWEEYASSGVLPAEIIDGIKDYTNTLMDRVDALYENMEEMFDTYLELLDKYIEKFDGIISKIDRSNSKLDVYQQLLEFSGQEYRVEKDGTHSGQEARKNIAKARISGTEAQLEAARASYDTYAKQYEKWVEEEKRFQEKHGSDISSYDEATAAAWNKIQETKKAVEDAMNEADDLIDEKMSQLIDDVTNAIEVGAQIIKEQTVESLNGLFDSFESMTETWDQKETLRLFFLEDYDKTYQLESLLRDVNDAMEDITDPQRMNEYLALVDEINAANAEGVKMTQTDMDLLKAKFELQQAQDLYEEQKNAKNTMRLARDASGNWSYVYSSNQSESEDAVQKLADAQHNYDKLLHEARDESSQLWLQTQQEFFEWQETIDWDRMQWDTKYKDQVNRTYKYYVDMTSLYADQVTKYNAMLGDNYADTTLGIITGYDSMEEAQAAYTEQHATYNTELEANQTELSQVVRDKCEDMGIDYDNLAQDVQDKTDDIIDENNRLKEDAWDLAAEADDALSDMADSVSSNIDDMIAAIQELEAEIQRAIDLLASLTDQSTTGFDAERDYTATAYNKVKNMDEEQAKAFFNSREGQLMAQEWVNKVNSDLMNGHSYTIGGKNYKYGDEATKQDFINAIMEGVREGTIKGNIEYDERDESKISQGVGDTGSDYNAIYGRPRTASGGLIRTPQVRSVAEEGAELILNSTDTQNILDAVTHMREVVRMKIQAANLGVDSMVKKPDPIVVQSDAAPIDQQVHIDATFPNVSVAAEIEEAFNNLVNQAVQYVSAKNK